MNCFGYYNGQFLKYADLKIPLSDRAIFFADGIYDAAIGHSGRIYRYREHYKRLYHGAGEIGLELPFSEYELRQILGELIRLSGLESYFLYFQLTAGGSVRMHERKIGVSANLLATIKPWTMPNEKKVVSICTAEDLRHSFCHIKTLNLLPSVLAISDAAARGYDECVFIKNGYVTECGHSNIFAVKDGTLLTPALCRRVLPGITRRAVISLAGSIGIAVKEVELSYTELISADAAFITATSRGCTAICRIDEVDICQNNDIFGKISKLLREDYVKCE